MGEEGGLAKMFQEQKEVFVGKSNAEIEKSLREELGKAMTGITQTLERRISRGGLAQPSIEINPINNRIIVELPGVKDRKTVRKKIESTANLQFFELSNAN